MPSPADVESGSQRVRRGTARGTNLLRLWVAFACVAAAAAVAMAITFAV